MKPEPQPRVLQRVALIFTQPSRGGAPIKTWPTAIIGNVGKVILEMADRYPKADEIVVTSGKDSDHGAVSYHYGIRYNGEMAEAIDFGADGYGTSISIAEGDRRMRDFSEWLYKHSGQIVELIHTTPFSTDNGYYVKNQKRVPEGYYGAATEAAHRNHVHLAMTTSQARAVMAKLPTTDGTPSTPTPSTDLPAHMYLIDIAAYQAGINLSAVKSAGFSGVNVKLGQGGYYEWTDAGSYISRARALGMGVSTFYWIEGGSSGASQAQHCLKLLKKHNGSLNNVVVQCDNEDSATWVVTRDFTNTMQEALGRPIIMYTGDWWAQSHGPAWDVASLTPYLWAPANAGYLGSYPGDSSAHWNAGYWGYPKLTIMQYAVNTIAGSGVGNISKSYIKDMDAWAALSGQEADIALTDADVAKIVEAVWRSPVLRFSSDDSHEYWGQTAVVRGMAGAEAAAKGVDALAAKVEAGLPSASPLDDATKAAIAQAAAEAATAAVHEVLPAAVTAALTGLGLQVVPKNG